MSADKGDNLMPFNAVDVMNVQSALVPFAP
jgi:hypothetical protein